jgi:hypothetical protein
MNKQQIIQKLSLIATSLDNENTIRSNLFRFMAELTEDGVTDEKTYSARLFPSSVRREIALRDNFTCLYCNRRGEVDTDPDGELWAIDHVIPFSKGGLTCASNGALSCWRCNAEKSDMLPAQYIRWLKFQSVATPKDDFAEGNQRSQLVLDEDTPDTAQAEPPAIEELRHLYTKGQRWDELGKAFFQLSPMGRQSELKKIMAFLANDGRGTQSFSGVANQMFHLYSPQGKHYKGVAQ